MAASRSQLVLAMSSISPRPTVAKATSLPAGGAFPGRGSPDSDPDLGPRTLYTFRSVVTKPSARAPRQPTLDLGDARALKAGLAQVRNRPGLHLPVRPRTANTETNTLAHGAL